MTRKANGVLLTGQLAFVSDTKNTAVSDFLAAMQKYAPDAEVNETAEDTYAAFELFAKVAATASGTSPVDIMAAMQNISSPVDIGLAGPYQVKGKTVFLTAFPNMYNPTVQNGIVKNGVLTPDGNGFINPFHQAERIQELIVGATDDLVPGAVDAPGTTPPLSLFQVAVSVRDAVRTQAWYAEMFGFLRSGGLKSHSDMAALQGIPGAALDRVLWLVDQQDFFQFEIMEYSSPTPKPLPTDWRPDDIGYTMIGLFVADFDAVLTRLASDGTTPVAAVVGDVGDRRICVRDPDGVLLELMEADLTAEPAPPRPRPQVPVAVRSVRLSVKDIDRSLRFFVQTLGLRVSDAELHRAEHESLWGLEGAARCTRLLEAGGWWVELVHYESPTGRDWPEGYVLSDIGLFNIGFGSRRRAPFLQVQETVARAGYTMHAECSRDFFDLRYIADDQGFGVQINYDDVALDEMLGFVPEA